MRRILTSVLVVAAGAAYQAQAPQSGAVQETFRTGVELVRLDVSVLDKDRRPIRRPTGAGFQHPEGGKRAAAGLGISRAGGRAAGGESPRSPGATPPPGSSRRPGGCTRSAPTSPPIS